MNEHRTSSNKGSVWKGVHLWKGVAFEVTLLGVTEEVLCDLGSESGVKFHQLEKQLNYTVGHTKGKRGLWKVKEVSYDLFMVKLSLNILIFGSGRLEKELG